MDSDDELFFQTRRGAPDDIEPRKDVALPTGSSTSLPVAPVAGVSHVCPFDGCGMHFTSRRWLDVHENEVHSPFWNRRFACLVCDRDFKNESKRYFHLVEAHAFPRDWSSNSLRHHPRMRPKKGQENRDKKTPAVNKKSILCRYVKSGEACPKGEDCWFAHSKAELVPDNVSFGRRRPPAAPHGSASSMDISE